MEERCNYCRKTLDTPLLCSKCRIATYCGEECADKDWYIGAHSREHGRVEHEMDLILGNGKRGVGSVFLGSVDALHDPLALKHIDSVVSALGENYDNASIRRAVGEERHHMRVTIWDEDDADISYYFQPVAEWILEQLKWNRHVLVHCVAGHSRSTSLLIYYMLRYGGFRSVDDALDYIQERRPTAHPNPGFMEQLYRAESRLF